MELPNSLSSSSESEESLNLFGGCGIPPIPPSTTVEARCCCSADPTLCSKRRLGTGGGTSLSTEPVSPPAPPPALAGIAADTETDDAEVDEDADDASEIEE